MAVSPIHTKHWTRVEYERLIDLGAFGPAERLELIGGQLVVREPQGRPHATGIRLVAAALRAAFGPGWTTLRAGDLVTPLAAPTTPIAAADLLL
jgi:hypothetical protein